jgi:hypothetical protein
MAHMTTPPIESHLEGLVAALVDWGATASQIVSHMEHVRASGASSASASTVDVFRGLLALILAPPLADHAHDELEKAAALLEQVNGAVLAELLLVPLEDVTAS